MYKGDDMKQYHMRRHLKRQARMARRHRRYMEERKLRRYLKNEPSLIQKIQNSLASLFFLLWNAVLEVVHILKEFFEKSVHEIKKIYLRNKKVFSYKNNKKGREVPHSSHTMKQTPSTKNKKSSLVKKIALGILTILVLSLAAFFIWFSTLEIPSVANFENRKIANSTKIFDRTGEILLYDIHEDIRRTVVSNDQIAQSAKDAIIAIEDHEFYEHNGVVWKSTFRAIVQTVMSKLGLSDAGTAGGSTLTQQVVKNTLLTRDQVISRKVKEWVLAYKIEGRLTKDEILEIYMNEAPYGGTVYGIQEASRRFFGIPASELSIAQSAYLAAIPNRPTFYSPYGQNKDLLDQRQKTVLGEMKRYGFITDEEYRVASNEVVEFLPKEDNFGKSLHFVQYVREQLEETYGTDVVENGGLQVITTLDYELQQQAEEIIKEHIEEVEDQYDASNAALVAIESETGHIITMVGSRDYFDTEEFDGNFNVAIAPRQPGSAFKPIAYATAFEKGYLPESTIFDTETQFNARCEPTDRSSENGCYSPNNYDFEFRGPLTWRAALAESRNIPAIKVNYLAGIRNVIQKARDMGITSLNQSPEFYGLGLVLGGGEVSLLEMTGAYSVFSNEGEYNTPSAIIEVRDIDGRIIDEYEPEEERVLDRNAARMVNSILSDNVARTPLFGSQSFLYFGNTDIAGKTGTTNDNRDAWLIGYSDEVAVGVWTGNNDNSPMKKGSSISGKPWRAYMNAMLEKYDADDFDGYDLPEDFESYPNMIKGDWYGGESVKINLETGLLASEYTPEDLILEVPQPEPHTILHWIDKDDPTELDTSQTDPQYNNWEFGVQEYAEEFLSEIIDIDFEIPTEADGEEAYDGTNEPFNFNVDGLELGEIYNQDEEIDIEIEINEIDEDDVRQAQLFVNNAFIGDDGNAPFTFSFIPEELNYYEEINTARFIVTDEDERTVIKEIEFLLELE